MTGYLSCAWWQQANSLPSVVGPTLPWQPHICIRSSPWVPVSSNKKMISSEKHSELRTTSWDGHSHSQRFQKEPLVRRGQVNEGLQWRIQLQRQHNPMYPKGGRKPQTTFPREQSPLWQECLTRVISWEWWVTKIKFLIYCPLLIHILIFLLGLDLTYGTRK